MYFHIPCTMGSRVFSTFFFFLYPLVHSFELKLNILFICYLDFYRFIQCGIFWKTVMSIRNWNAYLHWTVLRKVLDNLVKLLQGDSLWNIWWLWLHSFRFINNSGECFNQNSLRGIKELNSSEYTYKSLGLNLLPPTPVMFWTIPICNAHLN